VEVEVVIGGEFMPKLEPKKQNTAAAERPRAGSSKALPDLSTVAAIQPELRLMVMILEDAVGCYQRFIDTENAEGREQFREAQEWLFSDDEEWIFSFRSICDFVGLNPGAVRRALLGWTRDLSAHPTRARRRPIVRRNSGDPQTIPDSPPSASNPPKDALP
jgi:hypothetical protein